MKKKKERLKYLKNELSSCVISAGGKGSRLSKITNEIPKPLFPIDSKCCLERTLELISVYQFKKIYILTCYKKEIFSEILSEYKKKYNLEVEIIEEEKPLGECGGLFLIKKKINSTVLFINADLVWNIDLRRFFSFHAENNSDVTLFTHICTHPIDSDLVFESSNKQISNFSLKPHKGEEYLNMFLGNSGIAIFESHILNKLNSPKNNQSFCNFVLSNKDKNKLRVFSYNSSEYVRDIGTPERFREVECLLEKDLINTKSYINNQKCLFIDRDNTLIKCKKNSYIVSINQVEFLKKNINKIKKLRSNFDLAIVISNQPQISMGLVSWDVVTSINAYIINNCLELGLKIDSFTICPHHPHSGFKDEISELKQDCFCRKPLPGMYLKEAYLKNINLKESLMIGDSYVDELSSKRAGCEFIYVKDL